MAVAVILGVASAGLAQPAPDPAPVPQPDPTPPPAPPPATPSPTVAPAPPPAAESEPPRVSKKPPKPAKKPKPAKPVKLAHAPPIDARPNAAAPASPPPQPSAAALPAVALGGRKRRRITSGPSRLRRPLAAACLALAFAAIPGRVLGTVSTRLTEHRDDIGLAVVVGMTVTAVMFLVLLMT